MTNSAFFLQSLATYDNIQFLSKQECDIFLAEEAEKGLADIEFYDGGLSFALASATVVFCLSRKHSGLYSFDSVVVGEPRAKKDINSIFQEHRDPFLYESNLSESNQVRIDRLKSGIREAIKDEIPLDNRHVFIRAECNVPSLVDLTVVIPGSFGTVWCSFRVDLFCRDEEISRTASLVAEKVKQKHILR